MPILEVLRDRALDADEAARLPDGSAAVNELPIVARATLQLATPSLLQLAFSLGRAVPDGTLQVRDDAAASPAGFDPWLLLDAGDSAAAERAFRGTTLDADDRDRVKSMYQSNDPQKVALACRIAGWTGWKAFVTNLQRAVTHADPAVAQAAREAIAAIEGRG